MVTAIQKGLWFINGAVLSIRKWLPNFVASTATESYSAIWVRFSKLPTEYYDHSILSKIGAKLGKLVKTDICTSGTLRGRYARICVEVPLGILIKSHIYIVKLKQQIQYEGVDILCISCGMIGHTSAKCFTTPKETLPVAVTREVSPTTTEALNSKTTME